MLVNVRCEKDRLRPRPVKFVDCLGLDRELPADKDPVRVPVPTREFMWEKFNVWQALKTQV
jgi:hypothetical protein